mmetsp:Transcript_56720/g.144343  ORF Transcript_56720/g.144343 Transcript_56720/m.144343 type:complete len:328 (-) Transcript_56720:61-1044(-)
MRAIIHRSWYPWRATSTPRAAPRKRRQPETNSSAPMEPDPSLSSSLNNDHASSMVMSKEAQYFWRRSSCNKSSNSSIVSSPEPSTSTSLKSSESWSAWLFSLACCACMTSSWSLLAFSMAVLQKTPVTTLRSAKCVKAMYATKSATQTVSKCSSGSRTTCQLTPLVRDLKSVWTDLATEPQYWSISGIKTISPLCASARCCVAACVNKTPTMYNITTSSSTVQNKDFKVLNKLSTNSRNDRKKLKIRMTLSVRPVRAILIIRMYVRSFAPSTGPSERLSRMTTTSISTTENITMIRSKVFQPLSGPWKNREPWAYTRRHNSMMNAYV